MRTQEEEIFPQRQGQQATPRLLGLVLGCFLLGICLPSITIAAQSQPDASTEIHLKYQEALQAIERLQGELAQAKRDIDRLKQQLAQGGAGQPSGWLEDGNARLREQKYSEAVDAYSQAIAQHPEEVRAYRNRGIAYAKLGHYAQAIQDFDKTIALGLEEAVLYNERGIASYQLGHYPQAVRDFDRALALDAKLTEAYNNRGLAHRRLGNYGQALKDLQKASQAGLAFAPQYLQTIQSEIRQFQERLHQAGVDPGPADGVPGAQTLTALRAYQRRQGLPVTGQFDPPTQNALGIPLAAAEAAQSSSEVTPPRFEQQPRPEYPLLARQQGWEGTVTLHIELLANGTVGTVEVAASSGYPSLDAAAQETVQRWSHIPARRNGIPVTSWTKLNFTFTLKSEAETKK